MADKSKTPRGGRGVNPSYDLAVIGAGSAGLSVAYGAARLGLKVTLIERGKMGGECLNFGCVPSKALLHAARNGADWQETRQRIQRAIMAIAPVDSRERYEGLGITVITATARIAGPGRIMLDDGEISAKRIVIATGSRTRVPEFCRDVPYLTNETVWDMAALPEKIVILGAGAMGCEMAEALANLGANVTLVGKFLPREAPELAAPLREVLQARGVEFIETRAAGVEDGSALVLENGHKIPFSALLLATGREVDGRALGIEAGPNGIRTDSGLRVLGHGNIYAAGDCADPKGIGPQRFTHIASAHASLLIRRIVFRLPVKLSSVPPVRAIYTEPELTQVGYTKGHRVLEQRFNDNDRAIAEGEMAGLIRLVLDRRGRLIGAGIVCKNAGEMIGLYALAIAQRTKLSALAGLVLPYPTRGQAGTRAAGAYFAERLFSLWPQRLAQWLGRLP